MGSWAWEGYGSGVMGYDSGLDLVVNNNKDPFGLEITQGPIL